MPTLPWRRLRAESIARLEAAGVEDPRREVRWIEERASGRSAAELQAAIDEPATVREVAFVDQMVARRAAGEPLQYVLGRWGFRTLDLMVDRRVLIPRPETEVVAGLALDALAARDRRRAATPAADAPPVAVDLGTGSGAIALSLAAERWPHVEVWGTDASADALAVARANLAGLGRRAGVVRLVEGDWFGALPEDLRGRIDVVVSNPPYVADGDELPPEVADWEPVGALRAGPDGLDDIGRIVAEAPTWLAPGGALVVEIGEAQAEAVLELASAAGFPRATIEPDLAGQPRALVAQAADAGQPATGSERP
ncbi:MAG: peptide chain release factor N(5)-glutamine methyltransferase [Acidimicrobiia bacterium]